MDKNKVIEAAAKLVAKGAYDKAIKEYQKVLEADPKDVRILQKMGELFQKKNDNVQAAGYFRKVAESYTADGFFLKAVALYKQVLKLDPSLVDVNLKLAELHQQLQLPGEAMAYYQLVANHWDKQGDTRRSLEVLRKMVELDPDNVASRVKLADLYVREGLNADAATEFSRAAEYLKRNGRTDDYLRVAERLAALQPENLQLAKELAEAYLQRNDQKRALAKLQVCFKADSRDIDTLRLLAIAFQGLGQMSKTISVFKELARAYEDKRFLDEAAQVWDQVAQLDPNDPDVQARRASQRPAAPARPPAPAYAGATAAMPAYQAPPQATTVQGAYQPPAAAKPRVDNIAKLLTETDVYVKYGLHDKALEHLRKVFAVEPENIDAHEKAYAIYVASNNHAQAFEQLLNVLRLHTRSGNAPRAQPYLATILQQNPGHPEVPVFLQTLRMDSGGASPVAQPQASHDDAVLVAASDDEVIVPDEEEVISSELPVVAEEVVVDEVEAEVVASDEVLVNPDDVEAPGAAEPPPVPDEYVEQPAHDYGAEASASVTYDAAMYDAPDGEPATGEFAVEGEAASDAEEGETPTPWDSGGVGLGDEVEAAPTRVAPRLDPSAFAAQARQPLPVAPDEPEPPTASTAIEEPVEAPPEDEPAAEECDEASFFLDQGLLEEAREILETVTIAYPNHRRASELLARLEAAERGEAPPPATGDSASGGEGEGGGRDAFDLAAELASELGDFGGDAGAAEGASGGGDEYQVSVDEVFAEFKKGLEKVVKPEDVDTHYDLGVAYKEMGLTDDAVGEFSIARKGCVGKRKEIDCLSMIAMLQLQRGDVPAAVEAYLEALASEHATGEVEKSLRYELGGAYELAALNGRALAQYLKVQALDGGYRDVAAHVERLSAVAVPEDDAPPPGAAPARGGGARKVGYV